MANEGDDAGIAAGKKRRSAAELVRAPEYRKYYATNVASRLTDIDVRVDFLNEKIPYDGGLYFVADSGVILTLEAAVILRDQLGALIEQHEAKRGKVNVDPKRSKVEVEEHVTVSGP